MVEAATRAAEDRARNLKTTAELRAREVLGADLKRLVDLSAVNDHVRPEEIELAREQMDRTRVAIAQARLRLDSLRMILEGPDES